MKYSPQYILIVVLTLVLSHFSASAKDYLVSVGINDYSSFPSKLGNLMLPINDAKSLTNLYANHGDVDYALLLDKDATKHRIIAAMKKVFTNSTDTDRIIFFFSGHGYAGGICAYDGKLTYDEIKKVFASMSSSAKIIFVDACRAGGIRVKQKNSSHPKGVSSDVIFFLASRTNESSIERIDMKNGFFTEYLVRGLKGNADENKDRAITTKELYEFVSKRVGIQSRDLQHPVMWGNFNDSTIIMNW